MAKRRRTQPAATGKTHGVINGAGEVVEQNIDSTIRENYMPYAMSVILSRAIPEIDGFKPSHRKLLYTMYKMGLLSGARTKSANIVGSVQHKRHNLQCGFGNCAKGCLVASGFAGSDSGQRLHVLSIPHMGKGVPASISMEGKDIHRSG